MDGFKKHLKVTKHSDGIIQKTQDITIPLGYYGLPHCSTNFRPMITIVPVDSKIEYQITTYSKNRDDLQNSIRIRIFPDQELMHTQAYRDDLQDLNEKRRKMMEYLFLNDKPLTVNQRRSSTTSSLNY